VVLLAHNRRRDGGSFRRRLNFLIVEAQEEQ